MSEQMLTAAELAEIERLDKARTQGEWQASKDGRYKWWLMDVGNDGLAIWHKQEPRSKEHPGVDPKHDAAFIVACSTAVPKMLATIRALRAALPPVAELRDIAEHSNERLYFAEQMRMCQWAERIEALEKLEGEDDD